MKHLFIFSWRILWFVLIVFFVTFSCETAIDRQMDEIEQDISACPEIAYEKLSTMDSGKLHPESRRARYALLLSLARDKSYIDVVDDSLIQTAVKYYKSHGSMSDRMLAWYSLGRVQRNAGNNTGAIISFMQAKELAEAIPNKHYYGLTTKNMAELYGAVHDYDTELYYYQESSKAFWESEEPYYRAYSVLGEARAEMARGKYELADSLLQFVEEYARKEQYNILLASVFQSRSLLEMKPERQNPEKAISLSREAAQMGFAPEYVDGFGTLAVAFEYLNQPDSVNYYLCLAEISANTILDSIQLSNTKYWILDYRKKYKEANKQLEKSVTLHNKLVFNRENQQLANAISTFSRQEAARQAFISRHRLELLLLSIITIIALVCVVTMVLINRKRQLREKESKIEEDLARIQNLSEELQGERKNSTEMAMAINELIGEKINVVKMCADAYEAVKNNRKENTRDPFRYLDEDPVEKKNEEMHRFLRALEGFRKDDSLFSLLEESVNRWRDGIMSKLRADGIKDNKEKPVFSEEDYRILTLIYAGIPDRTIAFLMDMSCAAIRTRKTRYKDRFARNDVPNGLFYLLELAKSTQLRRDVTKK